MAYTYLVTVFGEFLAYVIHRYNWQHRPRPMLTYKDELHPRRSPILYTRLRMGQPF